MSEVMSDFTNKRVVFFIFEKSNICLQGFKKPEEDNLLTQMAAEITAASQNKDISGKDYWAYVSWDPELKRILFWHKLSNLRYYSIELTPCLSFFWRDSVRPYIIGKSPLIDNGTLSDIADRFDAVVDYIENNIKHNIKHSFLNYVDINIQAHIDGFLEGIVEDLRLNSSDVFTNAFNLEVYH